MKTQHGLAIIFGVGLLFAPGAAAAAPPSVGGGGAGPEEQACSGRSVGDACTLPNKQLGTCAQGTCNRLDYSGGSPPKAVEESCVVCQSGQTPHDGGPMLGSGGPPPDEGEAAPEDGAKGAQEGAAEGSGPPTSTSRCSVVAGDHAPVSGLALALGLLIGLGSRRRRTKLQ